MIVDDVKIEFNGKQYSSGESCWSKCPECGKRIYMYWYEFDRIFYKEITCDNCATRFWPKPIE